MEKIDLQDFLFNAEPTRRQLLKYHSDKHKKYKIQVFRNHSFELIEHLMAAYLDYADLGVDICYSAYDDSFSFSDFEAEAHLYILWIDSERYKDKSISFLQESISRIRLLTDKNILLIPLGMHVDLKESGVAVWNIDEIAEEVGADYVEERYLEASGTRLSGRAQLVCARELGLRYIPQLLLPPIKAIVVDLDNTLYEGVLGEDGINGITLTDSHKSLQERLKNYAQKGVFLAVISKNEEEDVTNLFAKRKDFPLEKSDFTCIFASWDRKSENLRNLLGELRISSESVLFIDDNVGEIKDVLDEYPRISVIQAKDDAKITQTVLMNFPRLNMDLLSNDFVNRKDDLNANATREEIKNTTQSFEDYVSSLKTKLSFSINDLEKVKRISELANKTNQFIFSYKRYSENQIEKLMKNTDSCVVSVNLSDRLSDSGMIAVCVGKADKNEIIIEEVFLSCRSLGRGLEEWIIKGAIQLICEFFMSQNVQIMFVRGERNAPAEKFVKEYLTDFVGCTRKFQYNMSEISAETIINR